MDRNWELLPKKIWFLWLQGFEQMPEVVRKCYYSWKKFNPDWELIFLDERTIYDHTDIKPILENRNTPLYRVHQSDVIRVNLLHQYGGIWVDATCFCRQSLNDWLPNYLASGFFAFDRPHYDRMFSSWFLVAVEGNELMRIYCRAVNQFWQENPDIKLWIDRPLIHWLILKLKIHGYLKRRPWLWYHPVVAKGLKIYPYFWVFYIFEKLYRENEIIRSSWDQTPRISADIPHKIMHFGWYKSISPAIQSDIDRGIDPLYKLTYKYDADKLTADSTLTYLLKFDQI